MDSLNLSAAEKPSEPPKAATEPFSLSINGKLVPEIAYQMMLEEKVGQGKKEGQTLDAEIKEEIITQYLLSNEARKLSLHKKPIHMDAMEQIENRQLARAYFANYIQKQEITEEQLRKDYQRIVVELGDRQYRIRQIIFPSEDKARAALVELGNGAKFADLAAKYTTPGIPKGGDMGWLNLAHTLAPISNIVKNIPENSFSREPVKVGNNWHLIAVEGVRPFTAPEFDSVRANLEIKANQVRFDKHINDLRAKANIK